MVHASHLLSSSDWLDVLCGWRIVEHFEPQLTSGSFVCESEKTAPVNEKVTLKRRQSGESPTLNLCSALSTTSRQILKAFTQAALIMFDCERCHSTIGRRDRAVYTLPAKQVPFYSRVSAPMGRAGVRRVYPVG